MIKIERKRKREKREEMRILGGDITEDLRYEEGVKLYKKRKINLLSSGALWLPFVRVEHSVATPSFCPGCPVSLFLRQPSSRQTPVPLQPTAGIRLASRRARKLNSTVL